MLNLFRKNDAQLSPEQEYDAKKRHWLGFLLLGLVLMAGGATSIVLPDASIYATSKVLGVVLVVIGVVKIFQSLCVRNWRGFILQELTGAVEVISGIMIFLNPLKGAVALSIFIAVIVIIHGAMQIALFFRLLRQAGSIWFAVSGLTALLGGLAIIFKLPFVRDMSSAGIAGFALLIAGLAYVLMSLSRRMVASRNAREADS